MKENMEETKMRTKFGVEESVLVAMFIEKMKKFGATQSGTYNAQDPTHWEETKVTFHVETSPGEMTPIDVVVKDVTWITTITFSEFGNELSKADWDPQDKKWININAPIFFDTLYALFIYGEHETEMEEEFEDPYGCLADYE